MDIKAIETRYKGYRFRSRLEARWAVFFDALGLDWEYEKEGFYMNDLMYLPDFFVRSEDGDGWFIEVKGDTTDTDSVLKQKHLDNHPPDYALGCMLVSTLKFPSLSNDYEQWNEMNYLAIRLLKSPNSNLKRVLIAVEKARSERFDYSR